MIFDSVCGVWRTVAIKFLTPVECVNKLFGGNLKE